MLTQTFKEGRTTIIRQGCPLMETANERNMIHHCQYEIGLHKSLFFKYEMQNPVPTLINFHLEQLIGKS